MEIIVECPHCNGTILINIKDLNCMIFRHGIFKKNYKQINPHTSKIQCDDYIKNDQIYGCGKPFKIVIINEKYISTICDYI
jgi:hypothetical protein